MTVIIMRHKMTSVWNGIDVALLPTLRTRPYLADSRLRGCASVYVHARVSTCGCACGHFGHVHSACLCYCTLSRPIDMQRRASSE